ncbi:MAG: hypothetical protein HYZ11_09900 [Candidatus Tectomicrobia bacterium]|uniref:Bacteriophage Mu GpT domain-containing protein n=1 Tax=Tectimicrobiota bacterium TaxID=2528274 RepID=A0A932HY82_UNCTE|nr:hypothetical protein [Candidatus Tectomicrobia bacterium]
MGGFFARKPVRARAIRLQGGVLRAAKEGGQGAWDFEVLIARPGPSREGDWFLPREVLAQAAPLFEGAQAFANHARSGAPDIKDLIGWHRGVRLAEEGLVSTFAVAKSAAWFHALAHDALERGIPEPFGFSFDVLGRGEIREEDGRPVLHILTIEAVHSVDVVHKGRLGGALLGLPAGRPPEGETDMFEKMREKLGKPASEEGRALAAGGEGSWGEKLAVRLAASSLPAPVREKLERQFAGETEEELEEAIRLEAATLEKLTASGALRGFGARLEGVRDEADRKLAALDGLWDPAPRAREGAAPYRFLSEAFQDFTGRRLTPQAFFAETFHYHRAGEDWNGIRRLSASMTTATWGEAFGDSIRRALLRDFRDDRFHLWRKIVSAVVPVKDFRTNRRVRVGGYGDLATVAEQATYPVLAPPSDEAVTYAVAKRGGIEDLTWEMIQNDDMGAIRMIPRRLARAAQRTLNKFVFDFLAANPAIYDGVALFHANHANTSANALTYANAVAGIKAMGAQAFPGEGAAAASQAQPRYLVHPTALLEEAFDVTQSAVKVVSSANSTQPSVINRLGIEPLWAPELTDANDWFLVADPALMDTIEIGFLDDQQEPELFIEDNPASGSGFSADKLRYKIRHVYGGAVLDHRAFYRGAPA